MHNISKKLFLWKLFEYTIDLLVNVIAMIPRINTTS